LDGRMDKLEGRMDTLENNQQQMQHDLKNLSGKVEVIYEQTAGLLEFRTASLRFQKETEKTLLRHEDDIALLKKVVTR
ncbi:MAG: hypothetical protein SCM57_09570, partial [Bacillota bacterium]|nr:hypothetical protein [Bacillota bacterium]